MGWSGIKDYGFGGKNRTREEDDEYRSRIAGVPKQRTWTKEKCIEELEDCLDILKKLLKDDEKLDRGDPKKLKQESIRDTVTLMNRMMEYMKYLYPPTQTNVNINLDAQLDDLIRIWREKKKQKTEVFEVVANNE